MTDPESDLRDSLQRCNADLIAALARYQEMARKANALSHEVERLREGRGEVAVREPVVIYCERYKDIPCVSRLELQPLHDTDVPVLMRLAGWTVVDGERHCPKCSKEQP